MTCSTLKDLGPLYGLRVNGCQIDNEEELAIIQSTGTMSHDQTIADLTGWQWAPRQVLQGFNEAYPP